jgi:spore germination protein
VPYDTTSWASLVAHADQIDYVATQTVFVNACGGLTTQDDLTLHAFAKAHGIGVIPSVFTVDPTVNHKILTDQATTARVVQALVDDVVTQGYDGLDVDLEGVPATDRPALTAFVRQLSSEMHARGKLLTMAVPAKQTDTKTGWAGAYDYAALAPYVDLVTIMSYDYSWAGGPPGSIAPYNWVDKVISYATSQFPANKVLLGVAFYGYDWNVTGGGRARALRYPQAEALASQYGKSVSFDPSTRSATFRYVAQPGDPLPSDPRPPPLDHEVRYHKPPPCAVPVPTSPPSPPPPPRTGQHTVWIEDAQSVAARLQLAQRLQTAGVATWRLGQEDPAVWQRVAAWRGDNASQAMNGG